MPTFFIIWIASSLAAWGATALGMASHNIETRRREEGKAARLILGRWFLVPGILFGLVAFALPILAMVQGIELLEAANPELSNQLPEWVFWVIAIGLIVGLLIAIALGITAAPRLFAQRVLIVSPSKIELRSRLTRRTLARIHTDQPFQHTITAYAIQSSTSSAGTPLYTHLEEITFTQGDDTLRLQLKGDVSGEAGQMPPPRLSPNRIHYPRDEQAFNALRETWLGEAT